MARTLKELDEVVKGLEADIRKLVKNARRAERLDIPVSEEDAKRGIKGRTERVLVGGKVVVRARKPG
jgi:hypothetical protein